MKCSVVFVCILVVFVGKSDSFKLLSKIKDLIRPTTSTTTENIISTFEKENDDLSESAESSEHEGWSVKSTTQQVNSNSGIGTNYNIDRVSSTTVGSFIEESSQTFVHKDEFSSITPPSQIGTYQGPIRENTMGTSTTIKYTINEEQFVKSTTERIISNENKHTDNNVDTSSSSNVNSIFGDNSYNFVKKEPFPTITPPSYMGIYPGTIRENSTSTTVKYTNIQEQLSSTTQSTVYEPVRNQDQSSTQVNKPTYSETDDTFEDAIDCGASKNGDKYPTNSNNELKQGQQPAARGCASGVNSKSEDIPTLNNEDQESRIIFPDNPVLKPTPEPEGNYDFNRPEAASSNTSRILKDEILSSTTIRTSKDEFGSLTTPRTKKAHVTVSVDDGRRIIDAPSKDCGPGRKVDENGRCRDVA